MRFTDCSCCGLQRALEGGDMCLSCVSAMLAHGHKVDIDHLSQTGIIKVEKETARQLVALREWAAI